MNDQHTRVDEDVSESSDDGGGAYDRFVCVRLCVCAHACVGVGVGVGVVISFFLLYKRK